jgi:hypothetical protein
LASREWARRSITPCRCTCSNASPYLGYRPEDCPESARAARETLALPIYPELEERQLQYVVDTIAGFYRQAVSDMDLSTAFKAYDVRGRIPDELNPETGVPDRPGLCRVA